MEEYKLRIDVETNNDYKQARTDIIKAFESISKITAPDLRKKLLFEVCTTETVKRAINASDEQMNTFLQFLGFVND